MASQVDEHSEAVRVMHPNSTWTFAQDLCGLCHPVYLFIWLFMCLLCVRIQVNAFFVDISTCLIEFCEPPEEIIEL